MCNVHNVCSRLKSQIYTGRKFGFANEIVSLLFVAGRRLIKLTPAPNIDSFLFVVFRSSKLYHCTKTNIVDRSVSEQSQVTLVMGKATKKRRTSTRRQYIRRNSSGNDEASGRVEMAGAATERKRLTPPVCNNTIEPPEKRNRVNGNEMDKPIQQSEDSTIYAPLVNETNPKNVDEDGQRSDSHRRVEENADGHLESVVPETEDVECDNNFASNGQHGGDRSKEETQARKRSVLSAEDPASKIGPESALSPPAVRHGGSLTYCNFSNRPNLNDDHDGLKGSLTMDELCNGPREGSTRVASVIVSGEAGSGRQMNASLKSNLIEEGDCQAKQLAKKMWTWSENTVRSEYMAIMDRICPSLDVVFTRKSVSTAIASVMMDTIFQYVNTRNEIKSETTKLQ